MYNNTENILEFINNNAKKYLYFLSKMATFPSVCDYSSYILGAYLSAKYSIEPIYVEGDYEVNDNSHCWLEIDSIIIDFTACQFLYDEEFSVEGLNEEQLYKTLIEDNNLSVIVKEEDELYDEYLYLGDYSIDKIYLDLAKESRDFDDYLEKVRNTCISNHLCFTDVG